MANVLRCPLGRLDDGDDDDDDESYLLLFFFSVLRDEVQ